MTYDNSVYKDMQILLSINLLKIFNIMIGLQRMGIFLKFSFRKIKIQY